MRFPLLSVYLSCLALGLAFSAESSLAKVVIAHRGASGYLPEHTLAGAAMAHSWGVDFIEPDVVLSKDNVPVLLHDHHLDTTTNVKQRFPKRARKDGRYYAIDFTLAELKSLSVHERIRAKTGEPHFPKRFPVGKSHFQIPTLVEFIELVQGLNRTRGQKIGIYPEIKAPSFHRGEGRDISKTVIGVLKEYGYESTPDQVFLQCFDDQELKRIRKEFNPPYPLIQLIAENSWGPSETDYDAMKTEQGIAAVAQYADGIAPWMNQLMTIEKGKIKATGLLGWAKKHKLTVHTYTLRADQLPPGIRFEALATKLYRSGVDGIFTDFGDKLVALNRRGNPAN